MYRDYRCAQSPHGDRRNMQIVVDVGASHYAENSRATYSHRQVCITSAMAPPASDIVAVSRHRVLSGKYRFSEGRYTTCNASRNPIGPPVSSASFPFPSERYTKMKVKSEKQFSKLHEPSAEGGSSHLPFDPEKYRKYLAETGWSEKVQDEWLETLWNMMGTFVDLAWGTDSVQTVLETERPSPPENLQPKSQGLRTLATSVSH